jgi:hypothetical protein
MYNLGGYENSVLPSGRTYYFIDIHLAEREKPISQFDKGKPVRVDDVILASHIIETNLNTFSHKG